VICAEEGLSRDFSIKETVFDDSTHVVSLCFQGKELILLSSRPTYKKLFPVIDLIREVKENDITGES